MAVTSFLKQVFTQIAEARRTHPRLRGEIDDEPRKDFRNFRIKYRDLGTLRVGPPVDRRGGSPIERGGPNKANRRGQIEGASRPAQVQAAVARRASSARTIGATLVP